MNDPLIESAKEIEALREKVAELVEECNLGHTLYSQSLDDLAAMTQERDAYRSVAEGEPLDAYQAVCDQLSAMTQERDSKDAQVTKLYSNWTEAQARIRELREALEKRMASENRWPDYIIEALATPDDSSALDAALKPRGWWNPKYPTLAVQLTKPHDGGGWEPFYTAPEKVTSLDLMPQAD